MGKEKEIFKIKKKIKKIEEREKEIKPTQMWIRGMRLSPYDAGRRSLTAMSSFASRQRAKQERQILTSKKFLLKRKIKKLLGGDGNSPRT